MVIKTCDIVLNHTKGWKVVGNHTGGNERYAVSLRPLSANLFEVFLFL